MSLLVAVLARAIAAGDCRIHFRTRHAEGLQRWSISRVLRCSMVQARPPRRKRVGVAPASLAWFRSGTNSPKSVLNL